MNVLRTELHDAARRAALDERDRLNSTASDYVIGRCAEAAISVIEGTPPPETPPDPLDVASTEVGDDH